MKKQFLQTIYQVFNNVIYTKYGAVAVQMASNENETLIRLVGYDIPSNELNPLSLEERAKHIAVDLHFSVAGVSENNTYEVSKRINEIALECEKLIYGSEEGVVKNAIPNLS